MTKYYDEPRVPFDIKKFLEENTGGTVPDKPTQYKRKPKNARPVHEIDTDDPYLDEFDIGYE